MSLHSWATLVCLQAVASPCKEVLKKFQTSGIKVHLGVHIKVSVTILAKCWKLAGSNFPFIPSPGLATASSSATKHDFSCPHKSSFTMISTANHFWMMGYVVLSTWFLTFFTYSQSELYPFLSYQLKRWPSNSINNAEIRSFGLCPNHFENLYGSPLKTLHSAHQVQSIRHLQWQLIQIIQIIQVYLNPV